AWCNLLRVEGSAKGINSHDAKRVCDPLLALAISIASCTAPLSLQAAQTTQAQSYRFDIPGQSLDGALAAFSAVTRVQVLVSGELTQGVV
ncbi:hypothetical protein Q6296_27400, partial [Klebsiella variicola]|uniref:hypothetical protein n=1 Tax=Klebsiella variicola TaxID=244366 RepID=UPI0027431FF4|nr:hypothetical protein [Klebsiella variicola]